VRVGTQRGAAKSGGGQASAPTTPAASRKRNAITKTAANTTGNRMRKRPLDTTTTASFSAAVTGVEDLDSADDDNDAAQPDTPSNRPRYRGAQPVAQDYNNNSSVSTLDAEFPAAKRPRAEPAHQQQQQQPEAAMRSFSGSSADMAAAPSGMFNAYSAGAGSSSFTRPAAGAASFRHLTDGAGDDEDEDEDEDDLIEIQAPQFSFSASQRSRFGTGGGGGGAASSSQLPSSVMAKPDIFDYSESAANVDLTQDSSGMVAHNGWTGMMEEA
jgi:hypothetical protein